MRAARWVIAVAAVLFTFPTFAQFSPCGLGKSGFCSSGAIISSNYSIDVQSVGSLVGYWRQVDTAGSTTIADYAATPHNATIHGGVTLGSTALLAGSAVTSGLYNGSTGYAQLDAAGETFFHNWDFTQPWTIEFLFNPNSARSGNSVTTTIFSKMQSGAPFRGFEVSLVYNNNNTTSKNQVNVFLINTFSSKALQVLGSTDLTNGSVWHVVVSYTGSGLASGVTMTINGIAETTTAPLDQLGALTIVNAVQPTIGARNAAADFLGGNLQELAVYNTAVGATTSTLIASNALSPGKPFYHYGLSLNRQPLAVISVPNVILSTDLASDIDDAGDVALAAVLHQRGEISLVGIVTDSANDRSADTAYAIAKFIISGAAQSFVGAWQGAAPTTNSAATSVYTADISATFGANVGRASYTDGVQKLRSILASLPDKGPNIIVGTGFSTVLDGFLNSAANAGGDGLPSGLSLINSKVQRLVFVAGCYPASSTNCTSGNPEYNFVNGPSATANDLIANWPGEVVFVGIELGNTVTAGPATTNSSLTNPVQQAFHDWGATPRNAWGMLGVLFAARGAASGIEPAGLRGTNSVNSSTGANTWAWTSANATWMRLSAQTSAFSTLFNTMYADLPAPF